MPRGKTRFRGSMPEFWHRCSKVKANAPEASWRVFRHCRYSVTEIMEYCSLITHQPRKELQYEIGNPLIATRMMQHQLPAALYAPFRVLLYENEAGD